MNEQRSAPDMSPENCPPKSDGTDQPPPIFSISVVRESPDERIATIRRYLNPSTDAASGETTSGFSDKLSDWGNNWGNTFNDWSDWGNYSF